MVLSRAILFAFTVMFCCGTVAFGQEAQNPPKFKLDDFKKMRFLEGRWDGAGYIKPFYEAYRVVNDSTIKMQASEKPDYTVVTDSSTLMFRDGQIRLRDQYIVTRIDADGYHFTRVGRTGTAFIWKPESKDVWIAVLGPAAAKPTRYTMTRSRIKSAQN